jgi:hypothetical protein
MAKYSLSIITDPAVPGAQGVRITWNGPGTAPFGMKIRIENSDASETNCYGGWLAVTPSPIPPAIKGTLPAPGGTWLGWGSMNPANVVGGYREISFNLANGPALLYPSYGVQDANSKYVWSAYTLITLSADASTATASTNLNGDVTNLTISVIGGSGGPE